LNVGLSQKRAEKQPCIQRLKVREIEYIPLVTLTPMALEIDHHDLTNRVCADETSRQHVLAPGLSREDLRLKGDLLAMVKCEGETSQNTLTNERLVT
jgi:hypothetical protein